MNSTIYGDKYILDIKIIKNTILDGDFDKMLDENKSSN